ncbi:small-conductance mechanosensitive channel [Synechococcus sp. PCC 7502]|uniref:mechanosensitive ion channel family protein n=1 Tax=Synechococcus sp. PCC 7502 TaxID=1173263 RepID=UPI00029FE465|nr:mechanosensitive ion channel family protein [Synechococcus sp. PCC 7502]AFY73217.1 small-conductance mechanosensitive channel [Synechococcus sp. PCC 7502]
MDVNQVIKTAADLITQAGLKIVAAIILWFVGRKLVSLAVKITSTALAKSRTEPTIIHYLGSTISVVLNIILIVALLGFFGIETTSFAALLAAAGVAIGAAWSGLLSNFAAGAFLVVFRPFKVGDFISVAGLSGTVREIGIFFTIIDTPDHVQTIIGNNKILSDNIQNYTSNAYRRVDLTATIDYSVDHNHAMQILREGLDQIPNVLPTPAPDVEILEFSPSGVVLAIRPYCKPTSYWQVYFDANRLIRESFVDAGFPVPQQHLAVQQVAQSN